MPPQEPSAALKPDAEQERQRLASLINSMADGVLALDSQARILVCNGAAQNVLDINTSMSGKSLSGVMKLIDEHDQPIDVYRLVMDTKTATVNRKLLLQYADGSKINLYLSIAPLRLGFGKEGESGFVLLIRDITREKSLEVERDEFISVVSHELRTPISIAEGNISNAQYTAEKSGDLNLIKQTLRQAHDQVIFLASLLNDLAMLSRAERDDLKIEVEDINASELAKDLEQGYRPQAEAKGLQLLSEIDPKLEILRSSKLYVREILQNFITNSIKYTETGSVVITALTKTGGVMFQVKDTGIGISKSDQRKLFEKFFRSEDPRTRKNSGTGLGLYVTMKLARLIKAQISIESELDKGSVFSIYIPNLSDKSLDDKG